MVTKFTYLGITLDEELKWKAHAADVHKKVSKRLGLLRWIRSSLTLQAAQAVYKCIIEPIFSYADTAWGELPESSITSCNITKLSHENRHLSEKYKDSPKYCKLASFRNTAKNTQMHFSIQMFTEFRSYILKKLF